MFWKNKKRVKLKLVDNRTVDSGTHQNELTENELVDDSDNNREAFRVEPDPIQPVVVSIDRHRYNAVNISSGGVAFHVSEFAYAKPICAQIKLPDNAEVLLVELELVSVHGGLCRCLFKEINEAAENLLHSYVLEVQKRNIRQGQGDV